jgi:hypothetical protein
MTPFALVKKSMRYAVAALVIFFVHAGLAQEHQYPRFDDYVNEDSHLKSQDSVRFYTGELLPAFRLRIGTEAPLQLMIGVDVPITNVFSLRLDWGKLFTPYTSAIFQRFGADTSTSRTEFIDNHFAGGRIWTIGSYFHFRKFYGGPFFQFQKYGFRSTPMELVRGMATDRVDEIEDKIYSSRFQKAKEFYEEKEMKPAIFPTQVGIQIGRRFLFRRIPQFGIDVAAAYSMNVGVRARLDSSNSVVGNVIGSLVEPEMESKIGERFRNLRIPSLTVSFCYQLGHLR